MAPTFVLSNNLLNVILLLPSFACLEYGSSNLLWLACTLMVPLSNLAFSLPGIPDRTPATPDNGLALLIITLGLCVYGFSKKTALRMLGRVGLLASAADARRLDATVRSTQQEPPLQASAATSATTSSSSSWSLSPARPPPPSPAYEKEGAADKGPEEEGGQEQGWGWGWWSGLVGWGGRKRAGTEATTNRESFESTMTGTSRV